MRAKTRRWVGVVLFAAVLFVIVVVLCLRGQGAQARQYSVSFADVVKYLSVQFKTDITDVQNAEVWGPHFLDPGTLYWGPNRDAHPESNGPFQDLVLPGGGRGLHIHRDE